ncbi:MAG: biotin/lipoate A/B protein ligase family protein [Acidimicrobiia bacterium]
MPFLPPRRINLIEESTDGAGPFDTGLSHAVALAVGTGEIGESLRLHPTSEVVAFGRQDVLAPGYRRAIAAARSLGFEVVERLAGGRAAVFHTGTLAFSWAMPAVDPRAGVHERFERLAGIMVDALTSLGADARIGEVPGEYCPGAFSVNLGGRIKVMGVGQRLVKGAAHIGGVVVVSGSDRLREVLVPVYEALELEWVPGTAGSLEDELPGISIEDVRRAILEEVRTYAEVTGEPLPLEVTEMGRRLSMTHRVNVAAV